MQASVADTPSPGRLAERNNLVVQHLPLVMAIASQIRQRLPGHIDLDDLVQAGTVGLIDAGRKFDRAKETSFGAYAKHRIRGAILDSLRELDSATRDHRRRQRQVDDAVRELSCTLQRAPTDAEIAAKLGLTTEQWYRMKADCPPIHVGTTARSHDLDCAPQDIPDRAENRPDRQYVRNEKRRQLANVVTRLPEREQKILALYYGKEIPMREVGRILGIHQSRASQIHKAVLQKMAKMLRQAGIRPGG